MPGQEGQPSVGVIAQDVLLQAPLCVSHDPVTDLYAVEYRRLIPYLIESVKSLKRRCDDLSMSLEEITAKRARVAPAGDGEEC